MTVKQYLLKRIGDLEKEVTELQDSNAKIIGEAVDARRQLSRLRREKDKVVCMNVDYCASDLKVASEENDRLKKRIEELEVMLKHGDPYARGFADGVKSVYQEKEEGI